MEVLRKRTLLYADDGAAALAHVRLLGAEPGTFTNVASFPSSIQAARQLFPAFHGIEFSRMFVNGTADIAHAALHMAVLAAWIVGGWFIAGFIEPVFWLVGVGVGLNSIVSDVEVAGELIAYREFVAPGLIAVAAMNGAAFDSTFNFFYKLHYLKLYDAMLATPLTLGNIVVGEVSWSVMRSSLYACVFLALTALLGLISSPLAILIVPVAALTGFCISAIGVLSTTFIRNWNDFDYLSLSIQLLFLCSGTFFPVTVYPSWGQVLVNFTPLYHSVELCRHLALGVVGLIDFFHLGVLVGATIGFGMWAHNRLETKLLD